MRKLEVNVGGMGEAEDAEALIVVSCLRRVGIVRVITESQWL